MTGSIPRESSAEVEQEAEDTRANLAHTLDQLRENLKPENVVDEVITNARFGAASLVEGLWKVARDNPLPALLIGAGLALVLGLGARRSAPGLRSEVGRQGALWPEDRSVRGVGADVAGPGARPSRAANGATSSAASPAAPPHPASSGSVLDRGPLIVGAVGLAVGGALGTALPISRTEEDWLGEASSSTKRAVRAAAQAQMTELKAAAGRAVEQVRQSASDHGLSTDNFNDLVRDVGQHAKTAVNEIGDSFQAAARPS